MKKLMFAAATLAAGFAVADIVSSDIVGYAKNGLRSGATIITAQFLDIGQSSVSLQTLRPTGDEIDWTVEIQVLDNGGSTINDQDYMWVDGEGWCTPDGDPITEDVTFAPGQGFWIYGSSTEQSIRFPAPEL